jgi:two-component system, cell cycle sensor histidine kinase and response regulator CckA
MGQLAGGIAHDFNNLLSGILGHADLLRLSLRPGSDEADSVETIGQAARRGAELTRQLLDYARPDRRRSGPIDIHRMIEEVLAFLSRPLGEGVRLERRFHPEDLFIEGEPGELHEALVNLTLNARDAMPDGGLLTFETSPEAGGAPAGPPGSAPGTTFARVTVRDTGCGIPPEFQQKVFEPFVTTKANGTGMGLAMVRRTVDRCGGAIRMESALGQGTAFHLFFPLARSPLAAAEPPTPTSPVRGSGCVLLVDDEETVLQVEGSMLEYLGYTVVTSASPLEALDLYRAGKERIDVVVLDLRMPRLSGLECLRALREIEPSVRVVLVSGTDDSRLAQAQAYGAAAVLLKPLSIRDLGATLGQVLAGRPPPPAPPPDA